MSRDKPVVIEVFGEGKTDVGDNPTPGPPDQGVVPILLHTLCGRPANMLVKRYGRRFMDQPGGLKRKVNFAVLQARYSRSDGAAFVVDSEGELRKTVAALARGREMTPGDFPLAIGVAHPCIEAWLLANAGAICRGLGLPQPPQVPDQPEDLPAPQADRRNNPKTVLARAAGSRRGDLQADEKDRIAAAMTDLDLARRRCPQGFAPFAGEVQEYLRPLF